MKKGFTLIELLAVIVILAIIALIATPIVLNIINETKESATLRSAEFYMDAVENAIAMGILNHQTLDDGTYNITKDGDICLENFDSTNKTCPQTNTLAVEVSGEKPSSGKITITGGSVSDVEINLNSNDKTIVQNEKGELVYQTSMCTLASDSEKSGTEKGAKYLCKVDPNEDAYTFYVLSDGENGTTNLILDRNVYYDETTNTRGLTDKDHDGLVAWNLSGSNSGGPLTAMTYLYNATKTWINVPPLNYEYKDKEWQESVGITFSDESGYESFISVDGIGKINGTKFTEEEPLRARMPIYTYSNGEHGEVAGYNGTNTYLYNYMDEKGGISSGETAIPGICGYWTLSSFALPSGARLVTCYGSVYGDGDSSVAYDNYSGVRPVINLKL